VWLENGTDREVSSYHHMFKLIYRKFGKRLYAKDDLLSGLTVALALVPEAVAFAIIAGVPPLVGLYGAFMVCLVTAVLGGTSGHDLRGDRRPRCGHGLTGGQSWR